MLVEELASKLGLDLDALSFTKAILLAEGLKTGLEGIVEVAKDVAKELIGSVTETAEYGTQLEEMSKRTGIGTGRLQELQYAAQQTGTDLGVLLMGIRHLSVAAAEAAGGNATLSKAFRELGVPLRDANGHLRSGDELFGDVAQAMGKLGNETQRTLIGSQLFSRVSQMLNPLMRQGESNLGELTERYRELGIAMSEEDINDAHSFSFALKDLNLVLGAMKRDFGAPLLRPLTGFLRSLLSLVETFRKAVRTNFDVYVERLKWALLAVATVVLGMILPGLGAWVSGLIVTLGWYVALSVQALITGESAALAAILPMLPWLALAAVILLVGNDLYNFFIGGDSLIGRFLNGTWARFVFELKDIWNTLKFYAGQFWDWLMGAAGRAVQWVVDKFMSLVEAVKGFVADMPGGKWVLEHAFGTGAQGPSAQAALGPGGSPVQNNFQADITVHPPPGTSPSEVASHTVGAFDEWHADVLQDAMNDSEEE